MLEKPRRSERDAPISRIKEEIMSGKPSTMVIALGLAALLSVAAAGCSNMKKSAPESDRGNDFAARHAARAR